MTTIEHLTAAQYYDFTEFSKHNAETIDLLSCFLVPDGFKYNEQYNISKLKESFLKLKFIDVKAILNYINEAMSELHNSFSKLFITQDSDDEQSLPTSGYESYGVFNYLMTAREVSGKTLDEIYETPITEVLFLVCWKIDKTAFEEKQIKEWQRKH